MRPKRPMTEPKISTTRTLTKSWASAASAMAQFDPVIPTAIPHDKLERPTVKPPQKSEKAGDEGDQEATRDQR